MKRLRAWFWRSLAGLIGIAYRAAKMRAARACGCDACKFEYDAEFRGQVIKSALGPLFGDAAPAPDRRPS